MTNFYKIIHVEVTAGTNIEDAIKEGLKLSGKEDSDGIPRIIKFNFNGVELKIHSFDTFKEKLDEFNHKLNI